MMTGRSILLMLMLLVLSCLPAYGGTVVKVGGYPFPPFVEVRGKQVSGLTMDLIAAMNNVQDKFTFQFVLTSSTRRYADMEQGLFDVIFFESIKWGWEGKAVEASRVFDTGGEVYVARKEPGRTQSYFDSLKGKSFRGYLGYHYGFAGFDADRERLEKEFNVTLTTTHKGNILSVLDGRADVAVVTESFLRLFLAKNPDYARRLLISQRRDQTYYLTILVRKEAPITVAQVNQILDRLKKGGELSEVLRK